MRTRKRYPAGIQYHDPKSLRLTAFVPFLIVLMNAQIFMGTAGNPLGIDGVQEVFYLVLIIWAFMSLWVQQRSKGRARRLDVFVLLLAVMPMLWGAILAQSTYGQPIVFGILEERRIFALLVYFPIRTMLERNWVSVSGLEKLVVGAGAICAIGSIGVTLGVVPTLQELRSSELTLRGDRVSIGAASIALGIPVLMARGAAKRSRHFPFLFPLMVGTLLVIVQSRQQILAALVATAYVLRGVRAAALVLLLGIGFYVALLIVPGLYDKLMLIVQLFVNIASSEYLMTSWRALSYAHSLQALQEGEIWGHGSLSPLWNGGFTTLIGPYFFLADIGVVGTLFRYGLFGVLLYAVYFVLQLRLILAIPDRRRRALYSALFLFVLVGSPVGAPLEYRGNIVGLILGVTGYLASRKDTRSES